MKYRIGVDLGGTDIKAGVVDEQHNIVCKHSTATGAARTFEEVVADMAQAARDVAEKAGLRLSDFPCIGVGSPSCINPKTGRLVFSNNTSWKNVPLRQELEKHLPMPVYIGNDANCAVVGESVAGAAQEYDDVLMLTLGTGVGGGLILGRKLYCGADGMGTELGHTNFVFGGEQCTCGIKGCLEAYASVTALIRETKKAMAEHPESAMHAFAAAHGGEISGRTSFDCAKAVDETALCVVDRYTTCVAAGIGGLVNVFRPQVVLIGGGLSNAGAFLLDRINARVVQYVFAGDVIGAPPVVAAKLGNDAGIIGAAYLDQW